MLLKLLLFTSFVTTIYSISELEKLIFSMPSTGFGNLLTASKNTIEEEEADSEDTLYNYKNSQSLAKVIQDILFLHLKQNHNHPKITTTPASTILMNTINKLCMIDPKYCIDNTIPITSTVQSNSIATTTTTILPKPTDQILTTTSIINVTQAEIETIKNIVKNEILLKLKAKTMNLSQANVDTTEKIYVYFIISIIFLSLLVLLLIIILSVCCVIYYKQKARLDYYLNENYFTYFNNKHPILGPRGHPTFTFTETSSAEMTNSKKINPIACPSNDSKNILNITNKLPIQEERITKLKSLKTTLQPLPEDVEEEVNSKEGTLKKPKSSFRIMNKCKSNFISLNGLNGGNGETNLANNTSSGNSKTIINVIPENNPNPNADDDEEDIVLEGDIGAINNLQFNNMFSTPQPSNLANVENKEHEQIKINKLLLDENKKNDVKKKLKITSESTISIDDSTCSDMATQSSSTVTNNNSNMRIVASPSVMRDRYYKLLREQVFPYLHRSPIKSTIHKPNENNFINDVLY